MTTTETDLIALNAQVRMILTDDDGACFDKDGKERISILRHCLNSQGIEHHFNDKWKSFINETRRALTNYTLCPQCNVELGIIKLRGYSRLICKDHGLFGIVGEPLVKDDRSLQLWAYEQREGQLWQTDLEAYITAYHEPAPDYCGDITLLPVLLDGLRKSISKRCQTDNFDIILTQQWNGRFGVNCFKDDDCGVGDPHTGDQILDYYFETYATMGEAICRALVAVAEMEKT